MKKSLIAATVAALFSSGVASAFTATVTTTGNNFTMLTATGGAQGGTNDVTFTWDGTYKLAATGVANANFSSPTPFAGNVWTAHHVEIFAPGTYTFYTGCASGGIASATYNPNCGAGSTYTLTVPTGQVGAHMLFDWSTSADIDVIVLWKMNDSWFNVAGTYLTGTTTVKNGFNLGTPNPNNSTKNTVWSAVSIDTDQDADNWNGTQMIDGPFIGSSANFSVNGITAADPAVTSNNPTGTGVGTGSTVSVVFDKAMNPATLTLASFTVKAGGATVCGGSIAASAGNTTFTCTPTALAASTTYTATVTTAAQSAGGVPLASTYTWTFTTGAAAATLSLSATAAPGNTTVSIPSGNGSMATVSLLTSSQVTATPPANVTFGEGLVSYKITGVTGGSTVPVTIVFPASIVGKTLYKVNSTAASPVYTAIPETDFTRVNSTTITMSITDCTAAPCNGYDTNATSGTIEDPIGSGTSVAAAAESVLPGPGGSPSGGCTLNASKPDYSLILALLASLGYLGWKRKKQ